MVDLRVKIGELELKNPVLTASGTFGYGEEFSDFVDLSKLGGFIVKGTTLNHREGNPYPRMVETPSGMLNAVGLQNPGIEKVISEELPKLARCFHKPVIANISGFSADEYAYCCEQIDKQPQVGLIEVNTSCPNVHDGGMSFGTTPESAANITRIVKSVTSKPVYMKLSPNVADIAAIAKACEQAGADGISLINTLMGMRIDLKRRKPILANTTGGLSGSAIFPVALRMVWQVYEAVSIPIIGMGGVSSAADVIEMMLAGATAVQIGAANLIDPFICKKIIEELPTLMQQLGITDLKQIIGGAHA